MTLYTLLIQVWARVHSELPEYERDLKYAATQPLALSVPELAGAEDVIFASTGWLQAGHRLCHQGETS